MQAHGEALRCDELPPGQVVLGEVHTSGATGRPIRVLKTDVMQLLWEAVTLRDHLWHDRDFRATLAAVRWYPDGVAEPPHGQQWPNWGAPVAKVSLSGPSFGLSVTATAAQQARWLASVQPDYLVVFPSLLPDLVREFRAQGIALTRLKHLRTVSECLDDAARVLAREAWSVPVHDIYSAQETGYIALQCPQHEHYHVQAESVYVEVLDDAGNACRPGGVGRVVVTPLYNFANPLVRYAIGDYAEVGMPCACGRGLPVLRRILGRQRNMLSLPDGGRVWPRLSELKYGDVLPVTQFQMVQKELTRLEVRLLAPRRGTLDEERRLRSVIVERLGYPFDVSFSYVDRIARSAGGKFEDFRSGSAAWERVTRMDPERLVEFFQLSRMPRVPAENYYDVLAQMLTNRTGNWAAFGVGWNRTFQELTRVRGRYTHGNTLFAFDWWEGLPEDWRPGYPRGFFRIPRERIVAWYRHDPSVVFVDGLFQHTLSPEMVTRMGELALVHLDCDLYASARLVLERLPLLPGTIVMFDEFYSPDGEWPWHEHEAKAFHEICVERGRSPAATWTPGRYRNKRLFLSSKFGATRRSSCKWRSI